MFYLSDFKVNLFINNLWFRVAIRGIHILYVVEFSYFSIFSLNFNLLMWILKTMNNCNNLYILIVIFTFWRKKNSNNKEFLLILNWRWKKFWQYPNRYFVITAYIYCKSPLIHLRLGSLIKNGNRWLIAGKYLTFAMYLPCLP